MKYVLLSALAATALTTACVPETPGAQLTAAPQAVAAVAALPGTTPISPRNAIALFESVCGGSLPNFAQAPARMAANGIVVPSSQGTTTMFSDTYDLSFKILDGPGTGQTCSMVFGSTDGDQAMAAAALTAFPRMVQDPNLGNVAMYGDTRALVLIGSDPTQVGNVSYYDFKMLSER